MTDRSLTDAQPLGAAPGDWQHFDLVLGLGADLLPVVPDPSAVPLHDSKVKHFGKIPSQYGPQGGAFGLRAWPTRAVMPSDIAKWSRDSRLGMCVRTGERSGVYAIDVDVDDPKLASRIAAALPDLPRRQRANSSKFLLLFKLKE